ncbi:NUDIX domain-containing protein [Paenibacillus radicis (ex Xue et al. 2023)]|uniref:NUDIX domain-containing protein n=1 Tax=Paenibacillus radicis (ex Xue et al. 2023) TaxID=2972489 RepID=A0ABT1YBT4_9BACL|nr:NUDIX domain-containing protein [Paenibacillus radicis (ex Xue et al. 2023)]MCR8630654.1 NUDIX domain-containing protein [Paenibacillus radicis (ex Xue et al. 2023)]
MRTLVTGGAIIRDKQGRILLQKRSDYGNWGLPGGAMEAGESIEETMRREVLEETGLVVSEHELYTVYSGSRMKYRYPDGNEVVFVMFIFNAKADLEGRVAEDDITLIFNDTNKESLKLQFMNIEEVEIDNISIVQRPVFEDLKKNITTLLRT